MSRLPSIILQLKREFKRLNDELSIQEMALKNVVDEETQTFNEIESRELTLTELLKELKVKQNINDELLQKHNAVQDKLKTLNEERKKDSKSVKDEKKTFLGDLGIRVCIKELTLPVWQIMVIIIT